MTRRPNKEDTKEADSKEPGGDGKFKIDSLVWAPHGPLIYEAKVLAIKSDKQETHLFVHYSKWNKKWDTWVNASTVLEDIPATHEKARKLIAKVKLAKEQKKRRITPKEDSDDEALVKDQDGSSKSKRRSSSADPSVEPEEDEDSGKSQKVCLKIPGQIKKELIHDWENITKNKRIATLPRPCGTVREILSDFLKAKIKGNLESSQQFTELCQGITVYFDRALPFVLLYNQERAQYEERLAEAGKRELVPSEVYGAEHLSRLFVKFPELLAHTQLSTTELGQLQPKLADFLKWFAKNLKYFGKQYVPESEEGKVAS
jgi:mortality factor 4-like protein 1